MAAAISKEPNGWFVKDLSVHHPDYSPNGEGVSLQEVRGYYLRRRPEYDPSMEAAPWYVADPSPGLASHLCNVCRHINFQWLLRNVVYINGSGPILFLRHMLAHRNSCNFCRLAIAALCTADRQKVGFDHLKDGDDVVGCWITSDKPSPQPDAPAVVSIWRRRMFVKVGYLALAGPMQHIGSTFVPAGSLQQIGSSEDECLGRLVASCADFNLVRDWVKICEERHSDIPSLASLLDHSVIPRSNLPLRVVDVQNKCVVVGNDRTRYVALSYVWGKVDQLKLLTSNLIDLSTRGAFSREKFGCRLPRTIFDAIELTAALGERYLWVGMSYGMKLAHNQADFILQMLYA
jgi:hypothetical protein